MGVWEGVLGVWRGVSEVWFGNNEIFKIKFAQIFAMTTNQILITSLHRPQPPQLPPTAPPTTSTTPPIYPPNPHQMQARPQGDSHTLYVQNINDKIKIETLKKSLYLLFSAYGDVIEVHLRKQRNYRGQAWVVFKSPKNCQHALAKLQDVPFYGKKLKLTPSTSKSDIIAKADGTYQAKAHDKLTQLARELEGTTMGEGEDGEGTQGQKRKLDHTTTDDSTDPALDGIKRSDKNTSRPRFIISDEPTAVLFALNFPPSTTKQMIDFFDGKSTALQPIPPHEASHIYDQLDAKHRDLPVWMVTFGSVNEASDAFEARNGFKISDDHRLKLAYCYDSQPLAAETSVQLEQ